MDSVARWPGISSSEETDGSRGILGASSGPGGVGPNDEWRGCAEILIRRSAVAGASDSGARSGSPARTRRDCAARGEWWHSVIGRCWRLNGVPQGSAWAAPLQGGDVCLGLAGVAEQIVAGYLLLGVCPRSIRAGAIASRRTGDTGRNRACGGLGQTVERVSGAESTRSGGIDSRFAHLRTRPMTGGHCRVIGVFPLAGWPRRSRFEAREPTRLRLEISSLGRMPGFSAGNFRFETARGPRALTNPSIKNMRDCWIFLVGVGGVSSIPRRK